MANIGIHPIDTAAPIGQLRLSIGDTLFTELPGADTTKEPRNVSYANLSDAELEALVASSAGSVLRATAYAYAKLAAIAAAAPGGSVTIKTNDLGYTSKKASDLLDLARFWSGEADIEADASSDDSFEIVHYPGRDDSVPGIPYLV